MKYTSNGTHIFKGDSIAASAYGCSYEAAVANASRLAAVLDLYDRLVHTVTMARDAMDVHGPCKNHSCRDCSETWKRIGGDLARASALADEVKP